VPFLCVIDVMLVSKISNKLGGKTGNFYANFLMYPINGAKLNKKTGKHKANFSIY
jgi:hypothetical protein